MEDRKIISFIDWWSVLIVIALMVIGWLSIFSVEYFDGPFNVFDLSTSYGKQALWIVICLGIAFFLMLIDARFYATFPAVFYILAIGLVVLTFIVGKEVAATRSWLQIGSFISLQPAELAKMATALAVARYLSGYNVDLRKLKDKIVIAAIILLPIALIILQNDTGTALVFLALIFVLYREGLEPYYLFLPLYIGALAVAALLFEEVYILLVLGALSVLAYFFFRQNRKIILLLIGLFVLSAATIYGVEYAFEQLQHHQKNRVNVWLGKEADLRGAGYNVHQSLIAIGSGGFSGKGFLNGTQTKLQFVPEQNTDFIFCTVGEEHGFIGAVIVVLLFLALFYRILTQSEKQKNMLVRVYGYGIVSIMFFHFLVNVGMTVGIIPVIGIPLPFLSYGGSSLLGFTIMVFVYLKLDAGFRYHYL